MITGNRCNAQGLELLHVADIMQRWQPRRYYKAGFLRRSSLKRTRRYVQQVICYRVAADCMELWGALKRLCGQEETERSLSYREFWRGESRTLTGLPPGPAGLHQTPTTAATRPATSACRITATGWPTGTSRFGCCRRITGAATAGSSPTRATALRPAARAHMLRRAPAS